MLYTYPMTWAMRRRLIIIALIAAVLAGIGGAIAFAFIHQPPSCVDHKQNQNEEGVDCGGVCTYLCSAGHSAPSVRFVRPLMPIAGRTDVIAYVDNPNADSVANDLHFSIELYSPTNTVVAKKEGTLDLPPSSTVPVFIPNFFSGSQEVARAFITFDTPEHLWYKPQALTPAPTAENIRITFGDAPRVTATAVNPASTNLLNVTFVVTLFDENGNAVAASQTLVPELGPRGKAPLVYTWNAPFTGTISRIEVIPLLPVPAP